MDAELPPQESEGKVAGQFKMLYCFIYIVYCQVSIFEKADFQSNWPKSDCMSTFFFLANRWTIVYIKKEINIWCSYERINQCDNKLRSFSDLFQDLIQLQETWLTEGMRRF